MGNQPKTKLHVNGFVPEPWSRFQSIMAATHDFLQGEFCRTLDERFRLSVPQELSDVLAAHGTDCILVKEQSGCLSLWPAQSWRQRMEAAVELLHAKMRAGKL